MRRGIGSLIVATGATALAACSGGPALERRAPESHAARFDGEALLALSDVDMAGAAYADGVLKPLVGAQDTLAVIALSAAQPKTASRVPVSNSVMAWPGALDVSADGRFAYVVETRAPAPAGVERMRKGVGAEMPEGRRLRAVSVSDGTPRVMGEIEVGRQPTTVHVAPDGRFALVSLKDDTVPLAAVALENGAPTSVTPLPIPLPIKAQNADDAGASFVRLAPNGRDFVLNIANTHLLFGTLEFKPDGRPAAARAVGPPIPAGKWIATLRWSTDGRHVLAADVAWGPGPLDAVRNGAGAIVSVAFAPEGTHRVVARQTVSLSPEGFDLNRAGDLLAVVNMERTYLPNRLPYSLFGRRDRASLSLLGFNAETGALTPLDGPLAFDGVLPEDAMFDADGDMIAVAVFHGREAQPEAGWIAYFALDLSGPRPRLIDTGRRTPTVRGVHDLALMP